MTSNSEEDLFGLEDQEAADPPTLKLPDPAVVATEIMLQKAIAKEPKLEPAAKLKAAIVLIKVPSPEWADLLCIVWVGLFYADKYLEERLHRRPRGRREHLTIIREGDTTRHVDFDDFKAMAAGVWQGKLVLAFAPDLDAGFPAEYKAYADYLFEIPPLTAEDIAEVVRRVCGVVPEKTFSGKLGLVSPQMLQLAYRPDRPADAFVEKLNELCTPKPKQAKVESTGSPRAAPTLDRLHGMPEAVAWGKRLASDIQEYKEGRLPWEAVDHGCLISGPPGVGKSLFARALAASCNVALILASHSLWQSQKGGHLGTTLQAMRKTFEEARAAAPCILFIDEVDSFPDRETVHHSHADYTIQVVNALLAELDGAQGRQGVVVVAACNHPHLLDPALVRSGRLDRHIRISVPSRTELERIFREHLGDDLSGEDLAPAASLAAGSTGADCERIVRDARSRARVAKRPMEMADLTQAIGGLEGRDSTALFVTAIHEAGHAYAMELLLPGRLDVVSLRVNGPAAGGVFTNSERLGLTPEAVRKLLCVLLSGRAAEQVLLESVSGGSGGNRESDLARATILATQAATSYGFTEELGLIWLGHPDASQISATLTGHPELAELVRARVNEAYEAALELMSKGQHAVSAMARALVDRGVLSADEVKMVIRQEAGHHVG